MKDIQETLTCPHCGRTLRKTAEVYVRGHLGGGAAGSSTASVPCPGCGGALDVRRMIEGAYDVRPASGWESLLSLGLLAGGTAAVQRLTGFNGVVSFGLLVLGLSALAGLFLRRRAP